MVSKRTTYVVHSAGLNDCENVTGATSLNLRNSTALSYECIDIVGIRRSMHRNATMNSFIPGSAQVIGLLGSSIGDVDAGFPFAWSRHMVLSFLR